ncbi:MAG: GNAT family N-acetyltransferase [Cyanobacteria bacterium P01_A01_bin.114]
MSVVNCDNRFLQQPQPRAYRIRVADGTDVSPLTTVLMASFYPPNRLNRWFYALMRLGIHEDLKLRLSNQNPQYCCLAAVPPVAGQSANSLIGTVEVSLRSVSIWQPFQPRRPYLANLAVHPDHRQQGIGRHLILTGEDIVRSWGFHSLSLHVATNNQVAYRLYAGLGYRPERSASRKWLPSKRILLTKPL